MSDHENTDHENIDVKCIHCETSFVTSLESYEDNESACPRCGFQNLVTILGTEDTDSSV